mmetsp:Transcript_4601/g.7260  ORF Transcript_4601/g.7260 Transcript_4601/m.7260 type:complete len:216 (-) Transcript_4601:97-744(-)|eukprot:CAMPEP_0175104202 /NCGR_PEP_ID=MMETSP0086_2-20121207/9570_1 /TAXON_ID=136419 /ORGANISM="Unknown Unknown, Strain D1" /LENGTH=215 /DNA_ID=CAMNT_0016379515 /DNA_START=85 /DNA_END=732 /DNA_ORIENTATION=-
MSIFEDGKVDVETYFGRRGFMTPWQTGFPVNLFPVTEPSGSTASPPVPIAADFERHQLHRPRKWQAYLQRQSQELGSVQEEVLSHGIEPSPQLSAFRNTWNTLDLLMSLNSTGPWPELVGVDADILQRKLVSFFSQDPNFTSIQLFPDNEIGAVTENRWLAKHVSGGSTAVVAVAASDASPLRSGLEEALWFQPLEWWRVMGPGRKVLTMPLILL